MTSYSDFIASKALKFDSRGLESIPPLSPHLFPWQAEIVSWALRLGRAAVFADCGLGKTLMQLEWASHVPGRALILAPLAVAAQTALQEAPKFGIAATYARSQSQADAGARITIANYDMLGHFDPRQFAGIALDESSILKNQTGSIKRAIFDAFAETPFKSCWTATPSPNDLTELGNHSEFLGAMTMAEMLAMFFVNDMDQTQDWRLKGHAEIEFWRWMATWAVCLRKPSDIGFSDEGYNLPPLTLEHHVIDVTESDPAGDLLFALPASTLTERRRARKSSMNERVAEAARLVAAEPDEQWLIWCDMNAEAEALATAIPGAVNVQGSDKQERKESSFLAFADGTLRVLISKPQIAAFGLNFQSSARMIFVGLSDSFEKMYQAIRRQWRFGQTRETFVHIVTGSNEGAVVRNINRKREQHEFMTTSMVGHVSKFFHDPKREKLARELKSELAADWELYHGDCVEVTRAMKTNSVHFSVFSPPFASLYTYSDDPRDMGNCKGGDEFLAHFRFLLTELHRITMPGRLVSIHCMDLPTSKFRDGFIGIRDFRGDIIRSMQDAGFIFHSSVCIWKDPVQAMQRTKALGLLHKQIKKDSCLSRQGIPDYLVTFRKLGDNPERVTHTNESFPVDLWQQYASPVWMDINPSDTLQRTSAREDADEKHICPLQLGVIRRALELWSNPGDLVFSPFAGIASEGYVALQMGRKFIGSELKESYWKQGCSNLRNANAEMKLNLL